MITSRRRLGRVLGLLGLPFSVVAFSWVFAWLYGIDVQGDWQLIAFLGAIAAGVLAWRAIEWPDPMARYLGFGAAVLLMMVLNRVLYGLDFFLSGERFSEWPFYSAQPEWAVFKGEVATVLGTFLVVGVWLLAGGRRFSPAMVFQADRRSAILTLLVVFVGSLVGLALARWNSAFASMLGQLIPTLVGLGAAAALFVPLLAMKTGIGRIGLSGIMSVPFVFVALGSGMKENIILSGVPLGFILWRELRSVPERTVLITVGVLLVGFITTYVGHYRAEVWLGDSGAGQTEVLAQYVENIQNAGLGPALREGLEGFTRRSNATLHRGWAVSRADDYGYETELVFAPMAYVFVPRVIWPDKPQIRQGWEFSGLVFGPQYISWSESSTAAGLFGALYLGGGWAAVVVFAGLIGWMIAGLLRLAFRLGGPLLAGVFAFSLVPFALRLDETWSVGALSGPVIGFVYVVVLYFMARIGARILDPGVERRTRISRKYPRVH